jgi:glycosyltransferase involved in cell wall biosynthesis
MHFADGVVVASSYLESIVKEKYPLKPVLVLSNGVDTTEFKPLPTQAPRHAVYYFGALNRLSLIEELLRSMPATVQAVPDTHFYIIGGGSALDEAKALVRKLGMTKHATFTGWVDMFDVYKYVQFGDIAVCCQPDTPTVRAASNLKVFQYMAMGSATVVSDVGDLKRYISGKPEAGVAVPAGNVETLATTITGLLLDDTRRTHVAKAGITRANNEYALTVLGDKLLKFTELITDNKTADSHEVSV